MMKIGFLIGVNDVGGAEYVSFQHVAMAKRRGYEVVVLSGSNGKFFDLISGLGVRHIMTGLNPDIGTMREYLVGCQLVFNCNSFKMAGTALALKPELGFSYGTIIHSNIDWVYHQLSRLDSQTDLYYAIHQKIADDFSRMGGFRREKFRVIPNCVDVEMVRKNMGVREEIRNQIKIAPEKILLGMVTRIAGDKNIMDAIRILHLLRNKLEYRTSKLLIIGGESDSVGSRDYMQRVIRLIGTLKLKDHVIITGKLNPEEVYRYIHAIDIGLNCSPSEGLPIALLEMMAAGKACVFPSIGEIPDVLQGRGVVIPIRQRLNISEIQLEHCYTPEEIRKFVESISRLSLEKRIAYGKLAYEYIKAERSLEYQEKKFIQFLNELAVMAKKKVINEEGSSSTDTQEEGTDLGQNGNEQENVEPESPMEEPKGEALPKVSVLMPVRDTPVEQIMEAVRSIINQDYQGELELVIVAHDCRMSTFQVLKGLLSGEYGKLVIRIVEVSDSRMTFSQALDAGLNETAGEIVVRMDSDDIAMPELVSKVSAYMEANPDIPVCGVQVEFFGAKQMETNHPRVITRRMAHEMPGTWIVNHPGAGLRKKIILGLGGYGYTPTGLAEDYRLWCKCLKNGYEIHNLPEPLVKYRSVPKPWRYTDGWREFLANEKEQLR